MKKHLSVMFLLCCASFSVFADNEQLFNVFSLEAQASAEVDNDEMHVLLAVEKQHVNPAALATAVNTDMKWALQQLKNKSALKARSLAYTSYPVYEKQRVSGWRASQQLEIKSADIPALSDMVGKLQKRLQVKNMRFKPTAETRKKAEDALIKQALQAFKARSELVRKTMSAKSYEVVRLNINTHGQYRPRVYARQDESVMFSKAAAAPAVEAGSSELTVTANGSIRLQ